MNQVDAKEELLSRLSELKDIIRETVDCLVTDDMEEAEDKVQAIEHYAQVIKEHFKNVNPI